MLSLKFSVNSRYLICFILQNTSPDRFMSGVPNKTIVDFQNVAYAKDRVAYDFIRYGFTDYHLLSTQSLNSIAGHADDFVASLKSEPTYRTILSETLMSLEQVRTEWEMNFVKSQSIIDELIGTETAGQFSVYLTHPALKQGQALSEHDLICWAHRTTFDNYNTVYLWHELLHCLIPGGDLEHAIIQLISDNELRIRLNGGEYPPFEGHKYLWRLTEIILPHWRSYLEKKDKSIKTFIALMADRNDVKAELIASRNSDTTGGGNAL